jgi:hypothetical protein
MISAAGLIVSGATVSQMGSNFIDFAVSRVKMSILERTSLFKSSAQTDRSRT